MRTGGKEIKKKQFFLKVLLKTNKNFIIIFTGTNIRFPQDKSVKGTDINERKRLRAQKLEEFKEHTERVYGASFEDNKWKFNNRDDEKKIEIKMFERKLMRELNLTGHE